MPSHYPLRLLLSHLIALFFLILLLFHFYSVPLPYPLLSRNSPPSFLTYSLSLFLTHLLLNTFPLSVPLSFLSSFVSFPSRFALSYSLLVFSFHLISSAIFILVFSTLSTVLKKNFPHSFHLQSLPSFLNDKFLVLFLLFLVFLFLPFYPY